jgi:hypothetical protein
VDRVGNGARPSRQNQRRLYSNQSIKLLNLWNGLETNAALMMMK